MRRSFFFLIFVLAGFCVLIALGVWQVQRMTWKQDVLSVIDSRIVAPPVALPIEMDRARDKYLPVQAAGRLIGPDIRVLVSRKNVGAGYRIITPTELVDGRRVLVDRGFVPVAKKVPEQADAEYTVTGNLHWPQEVDGFTPDPDLRENLWFARDVDAMAKQYDTAPILIIARETSLNDAPISPFPIDSAGIPNDHLNYAITWFSLAFLWAAMTIYYLVRQRRPKED